MLDNLKIGEILTDRIDVQKRYVGIVVGIVDPQGRRIVAQGQFARQDMRQLSADTIFEIGSVTKVFTSLLLSDMVKRSAEVALDDPVANFLAENVKIPERGGRQITLLDLSQHTSGLLLTAFQSRSEGTFEPLCQLHGRATLFIPRRSQTDPRHRIAIRILKSRRWASWICVSSARKQGFRNPDQGANRQSTSDDEHGNHAR